MKRDFIQKDQLSEHDYLFDKSLSPYKWYTGKIKALSPEGYYLVFCQNLPGAVETDPTTWIPGQPATDNQSSVKYNIGQTVNIQFLDGDTSFASIFGLNRDYHEPINSLPTKDAIHEASALQSITFDKLTNEYVIKSGTSTVKVSVSGVTIIAPTGTITIPASTVTGNITMTGTLIVNGMDIFTTITALSSALSALNALYLAHTHTVTTAPGVTGPPI